MDITLNMKPKLPKLNNLTRHVLECKGAKDDKKDATTKAKINLKCSAELMEMYLKESELNLEIITTYKEFLRIFLAWIYWEV